MFYPRVGKSTLGLLERLGVQVDYPFAQRLGRVDGVKRAVGREVTTVAGMR